MTNRDHIPPHLRDHIARSYATGRLDSTRLGDQWLDINEFVRAALRERPATLQGLQRLYDTLVSRGGSFVYGTSPHPGIRPDPGSVRPEKQLYMDHTECTHPATTYGRRTCRTSAKMAGTWPLPPERTAP